MKTNSKKNLSLVISAIVIIILLASVVIYKRIKENDTWELAKTKNTFTSYESYLKEYPNGRFKLTADSLFDESLWSETKKSDNFNSYQTYIKKLSKGKYTLICDSISQSILWIEAKNSQTNDGYKKYISIFPKGKYAEEAKSIINKYSIELVKDWGFEMKDDMLTNTIYKDFKIIKTVRFENNVFVSSEPYGVDYFNVFENGKKMLIICPKCIYSFKILTIVSEKYRTNKNIGVGSTIAELIKAYPKGKIIYQSNGEDTQEGLTFKTDELKLYFGLNINDLKNIDYFRKLSDEPQPAPVTLKISDLGTNSKVKEIYIDMDFKATNTNMQKTPIVKTQIEEKKITINNNGTQITLLKTDNSYLKEYSGRYVWQDTGIWEGIPGGITIDGNSITLWGSVLNSLVHDKGDYPNINGAVATGCVLNNDGNVYSDITQKYLSMDKFSHKTKYMNFSNRQFAGESWEYFNQRQRVLHLHREGNTLQMIFTAKTVYTMTKQ